MRVTPVYRLPYVDDPDENITGPIERTRFTAIDRQLESLFTFLGDGIIAGWILSIDPDNNKNVRISRGSGVISSVAAATTGNIIIDDLETSSKNFIYAKLTGKTPYTAQAEFLSSTAQFESNVYLCLGAATTDAQGNIVLSEEGRVELGLVNQVVSIISEHVHTGAPGEPSKIDLFNHVKGVLSAANIEDLDASKITSGQFDRSRFQLSHTDLSDIGTLSHEDLDTLIDRLQKINKILFGDIMSANLLQLLISMKHVWQNFDNYMINFAAVIPGLGNNQFLSENTFIDTNATTAEVDYFNRRIKGIFVEANEIGQVTINSLDEWSSGDYNSEFVRIEDNSRAFGYGYGQGSGGDYFDVIETNFKSTFDGTQPIFSFPGSLIGWGTTDITGEQDFETYFANTYGYGYGWEYATGFPSTLSSTIVTLNPSSASLVVFDDTIGDYKESVESKDFTPSIHPTINQGTNLRDFLFQMSNSASEPSAKRRSTTINAESGATSDDIFSFIVGKQITVGDANEDRAIISDISAMYTVWEEPFDLTLDNYVFFTLEQAPKNSSTAYADDFDSDWRFDHSMSLYFEFTVEGVRYIYQYKENGASNFKFFDRDIGYFDDQIFTLPVNNLTPAQAVIAAEVNAKNSTTPSENLVLAGYYEIDESLSYSSTPPVATSAIPSFSILIQNLTGIFLVATNGSKSEVSQPDSQYRRVNNFGPIERVQGQRNGMDPNLYSETFPETEMPVVLSRIYMSGSLGFSSDIERNQISDISITFPEAVDFTSISWVSEELSDSLIYIQIEKVGDGNGYLTYPIYTKKDSVLLTKVLSGFSGLSAFPQELDGYRTSGGDFPESFKNTTKINLKVVLIPSSDSLVAPTISSITVNYNSQTAGGEFTISTQSQWSDARSQRNLKVTTDGKISILDFSRTKNLIYGSDGRVVEFEAAADGASTWTTPKLVYTGNNLPQTATQLLGEVSSRIAGKVTDLKILNDGRVAFLDREASRVVITKYDSSTRNYVPDVILASEFAWNNTLSASNKPTYAQTATFVKAVYNEELGDNGVLYCVFTHELSAWRNGVITRQNATGDEWNVDPTKFVIRKQGTANDLSASQVFIADRGILAFVLDAETSNLIKGQSTPKIDLSFDATSSNAFAVGNNTAVRFLSENIVASASSRVEVSIEKIGRTSPPKSTGNYSLIYMPIQTILAFDIDDNDNMYLFKLRRPYSWDTDDNGFDITTEPYFARVDISSYWTGWSQTQNNINDVNFQIGEPIFFTNNIYGNKGSIEFVDPFLLMCFSGQKQIYISQAATSDSGVVYSSPQLLTLPSDGTYPMSARIDRYNYTSGSSPDYGGIYVALSDLNVSGTSVSKSRVIKLDNDGETIVWEWGIKSEEVDTYASVVNDVRVLLYENDKVIVST